MKTYEEMAQNALDRIRNYETERKKRRKTAAKIAAPAVSFCFVAVLCVSAWQSGLFKTEAPLVDTDNGDFGKNGVVAESDNEEKVSTDSDKGDFEKNGGVTEIDNDQNVSTDSENQQNVTTNDSEQKASNTEENWLCLFWWKNKLTMGGELYWAIENNSEDIFKVQATYHPATANVTSFVYEGKTLSRWAIEADNERIMPEKMAELLKEGDTLKYGEMLYQGGAPNGEKWAKSLYDERIAFYGEELLGKYIVNGEFLKDALEADIAEYNNHTAAKGYKMAYNAYLETVLPAAMSKLTENNIQCEQSEYLNNGLILVATAEQLENLPLDDLGNWTFNLVSDNLKGTPSVDDESVPTIVN